MEKLPKIGQGVRLNNSHTIPGTGEVVAIMPPHHTPTPEEMALYYGVSDPNAERYKIACHALKCSRIIIKRDDAMRYLIIPPQLWDDRFLEEIDSPDCPLCGKASPFQKYHDSKCPRCGGTLDPEFFERVVQFPKDGAE